MPKLFHTLSGCCGALMCVTGALAVPLMAQTSDLRPGDIARVSATTPALKRFVGRIVSLTADTLALETDEPIARVAIPRAALTSAERRLPNASRAEHAVIGAALGVVAGGAIGGVAGAAGGKPCNDYSDGFCGRGLGAFFGGVGGAVLGLIAGATIGLGLPVERWSAVKNLQLSVTPIPAVRRGELLGALRF